MTALNDIVLRSRLDASPTALATVVIAHVAAALLIVQLFEARRYIEAPPLMVNLLPAPQEPAPDVAPKPLPQAPVPVREIKREPVTEPVKPVPVQEVRHEPKPVERVVLPEPAPERAVEPPPPPPQSITEVPVAPPPAPVVVAAPVPQPITPAPVAQLAQEPDEVTLTSQMLAAIYLRNPKPSYPNLSRRLSEQGTVLVRVFVNVEGDATKIELKESSGFPRLDHAALDAVQGWKFVPAKKGEQAVAAWVIVPIKFSLKG
ncbi:MAG TPA: energy transducer TonB [Burkholderiales bacterium]|nr:energy transducer TonB [Burkholderiales bacterium]